MAARTRLVAEFADHIVNVGGAGVEPEAVPARLRVSISIGSTGRSWHILVEAHDEWQTGDRRYLAEGTMALITAPAPTVATTELAAA